MMEQNRFKSKVVWATVAAQILAMLVAFGVIDTNVSETLNTAIAAMLQVFVIFGALNNPTNPDGF